MRRLLALLLAVPLWVAAEKPHAVLVVGTHHYSPQRSMPLLAAELERFGFRTTLVSGDVDPEKVTENALPGIEALAEADLAIFFMRFLKLGDAEWAPIEAYLKSGKPVVGLRTANHSFKYPKGHPRYGWNDGFGRRALGTPYLVHQKGSTEIEVEEAQTGHPVLANLGKTAWVSPGTLYLARLEEGCVPLVVGSGKGRARVVKRDFGEIEVSESETAPVAWVWENEWGGKVFYTSFGHVGDFAEEAVVRMLVNSACWAVGRPAPGADAEISTWEIGRAGKK